jgi:hypothetical protein
MLTLRRGSKNNIFHLQMRVVWEETVQAAESVLAPDLKLAV